MLKKRIIISLVIFFVFVSGVITGYFLPYNLLNRRSYIPKLFITGDVLEPLTIDSLDFSKDDWEKIFYNDRKIEAISLEKVMSLAEPAGSDYSVSSVGEDGRTAEISGSKLKDCYLGFGSENGWEAVNFNYPVSTNIKRISEIIVVLNNKNMGFGFNIINMDENLASITPGQMSLNARHFFQHKGTSYKDVGEEKFEDNTFEAKNIFRLEDLLDPANIDGVLLMGEKGQYRFIQNEGYFEIESNYFNYIDNSSGEKIENVKGVVINPSSASIMDVYYDATGFINSGKKVLFILTDGLGYNQYEYALNNGFAPFLATKEKAKRALSVYMPVSNSGLAAMFTGKPPEENGIYSRKQREPQVPTIFGELLKAGKTAILIEGDIQIIKTEIEADLHTDTNSSGSIDDEILNAALSSINGNYDFIAVHFHSIDDSGHDYGDISEKTMETVRIVDSYIEKLAGKWDGKIIVTADHGMHSTQDGGSHGEFRYEDMVVPYLLIDGGL